MKKRLNLFLGCIIGMLALSSCSAKTFYAENFHYKLIDKTSIAIGNINRDYSSNVVFVPSIIDGYTVKKLGFDSGLGFGGNGYLISYVPETEAKQGYRLEKFYYPNTITDINIGYMKYTINLKVFYCGTTLNLGVMADDETELYVPNEEYNKFYNAIDENNKNHRDYLYRANVAYMLNYETKNPYYYLDNYEYERRLSSCQKGWLYICRMV